MKDEEAERPNWMLDEDDLSERMEKRVAAARELGTTHPLELFWFLVRDAQGKITYQGQIRQKITDDLVLVDVFEWFFGQRSESRLMPLSAFVTQTTDFRNENSVALYAKWDEFNEAAQEAHK